MLAALYPTQSVCPRLVSALYAEAARLDAAWRRGCPNLPNDLDSRMVAAVLRELDRRKYRLHQLCRSNDALVQEARALLRLFWQRNARRDWARAQRRQPVVSLDTLTHDEPRQSLYATDLWGGEAGRAALDHLVHVECLRPETAAALVLHFAGYSWDEVVSLLTRRGLAVSHEQVRQWGVRYGERCRKSLRQAWK